jgi:acetyltransferase-like isoleucine patch superfamily enzyme
MRFLKIGMLQEYEIFLLKKRNPKISISSGFKCTNTLKFTAGRGSFFGTNVLINCGGEDWSEKNGFFICGINCFFGPNSVIFAAGGIEIFDNVLISPSVNIISHQHNYRGEKPYSTEKNIYKKITIHNNVWIGSNATILPGTTIGENSIIAANAVVIKDIPANVMVGGIPAKILKQL